MNIKLNYYKFLFELMSFLKEIYFEVCQHRLTQELTFTGYFIFLLYFNNITWKNVFILIILVLY